MNNQNNYWIFIILTLVLFVGIILLLVYFLYTRSSYVKNEWIGAHRENVDKTLKKIATKVEGSNKTPIYIIDNFLTDEECNKIINENRSKLTPSTLTRADPNDANFRTSKTSYFNGTGIQDSIENKICKCMGLRKNSSESSQIQYYDIGNEFKAHWDYFDELYDKDHLGDGQRSWTFMVYLNNVKKGGATEFTKLNQKIYPKKGTAVVWCSLTKDAKPDKDTMHRGTPVEEGEKFIITKWFLNNSK